MATFTLSADANIDELTGKTGSDTYSDGRSIYSEVPYRVLTIDQHSLYGYNQTPTSTINKISGVLSIHIDSRKVRMIPFDNGSGTIPILNTLITSAGASGKLMCVYTTDMKVAPLVDGATMPTTGWIQIKQWNNVEYTTGALTGITANCTGSSKVGFLQILFDTTIHIANILVKATGEWFELGATDGTNTKVYQIPTNGTNCYIGGVMVEKAIGSGTFDIYTDVSHAVTTDYGTEEIRGKVCWIDKATGEVRLGSFDGSTVSGYTPSQGRRVVIPNIFMNLVDASVARDVVLTGSISAEFTHTDGLGGLDLSKTTMDIGSAQNPAFVNIDNVLFTHTANYHNYKYPKLLASPNIIKNTLISQFISYYNDNDVFFKNCVFVSTKLPYSSIGDLRYFDNSNFVGCTFHGLEPVVYNYPSRPGLAMSTVTNCNILDCLFIGCQINVKSSQGVNIKNIRYISEIAGSAINRSGWGNNVVYLLNRVFDSNIDGITFPLNDNIPNGSIIVLDGIKNTNTVVSNIGTIDNPLDVSSAPFQPPYLVKSNPHAKTKELVVKNCYVNGLSSGLIYQTDILTTKITNSGGDYVNTTSLAVNSPNSIIRGARLTFNNNLNNNYAYSADNNICFDFFDSPTSGYVQFWAPLISDGGLDKLTVIGGTDSLIKGRSNYRFPISTVGRGLEFEMGYYRLGHTGFRDKPVEMDIGYFGTATAFDYDFAIDVNDGNGYTMMTTAAYSNIGLGTALSSISVDPTKGFKLKLRIVRNSTTINGGNVALVRRFAIFTTSSLTAQVIKYPDKVIKFTLNGLVPGSDVVILKAGTNTVLTAVDQNPTSDFSYAYSNPILVDIGIIKPGYITKYLYNFQLPTSDSAIPIAQLADRNYI